MKTRILSLLLAVALFCAMLPQFTLSAGAAELQSGTCGDSMTWRFDAAAGTLILEGSGAMYDYDYLGATPWFDFRTQVASLTLPAGMTYIGEAAFAGCSNLKEVSFPESLASIGQSAFYNCSGLTALTMPKDLVSIGPAAFYNCHSLTQVSFPEGMAAVNEYAFFNCTALTEVVLPLSITEIGEVAFGYWFDAENEYALERVDSFTVFGYEGSAVQTYAQENEFRFVALTGTPFVDVKKSAYYFDAVRWAIAQTPRITAGTDATHFSPNKICTRAEMVTFLWNVFGRPEPEQDDAPFVDVKTKDYFYKAVLWAKQNGFTSGVDATHFNPKGSCTRAEAVTFLWSVKGKPALTEEQKTPFTDVAEKQYYANAVRWAYANGVTSGTDATHFSPKAACTRAQIVTFLYKLFGTKN